jgi:hypothetical protein
MANFRADLQSEAISLAASQTDAAALFSAQPTQEFAPRQTNRAIERRSRKENTEAVE